jgi:hypothetical protein
VNICPPARHFKLGRRAKLLYINAIPRRSADPHRRSAADRA